MQESAAEGSVVDSLSEVASSASSGQDIDDAVSDGSVSDAASSMGDALRELIPDDLEDRRC